jgi:hypothetical protein
MMYVYDCVITGCTYGVNPDTPLTLDGLAVSGSAIRIVDAGGVATVSLADIQAQVACNNSLLIYAAGAVALTITHCSLRGTSFSGANRMVYLNHAGISAAISGCIFGSGFSSAIYATIGGEPGKRLELLRRRSQQLQPERQLLRQCDGYEGSRQGCALHRRRLWVKIKRCNEERAENNNAKDAEKTNLFMKTPRTLCLSGEKNTVISAISALKGRCKS